MSTDRNKAIERVSKLLNMANDKGASEQEALTAAAMATKMMEEWNIAMTEVGIKSAEAVGCVAESTIFHNNWKLGDHELARPIARLCECKYWHIRKTNNFEFFGIKHEAEYAMYLYEMLSNTIKVELEAYKLTPEFAEYAEFENKITLYRSFIRGMQRRLAERLYEMALEKEHNVKLAKSHSNALVVMKQEVIQAAFEDTGTKLKNDGRKFRAPRSKDAFTHGKAAGDKVNITTGIDQSNQKRIG